MNNFLKNGIQWMGRIAANVIGDSNFELRIIKWIDETQIVNICE